MPGHRQNHRTALQAAGRVHRLRDLPAPPVRAAASQARVRGWPGRQGDGLADAIRDATRPVGCGGCGRTFAGQSARTVAHDGDRCLPASYWEGMLTEVDGVLVLRGDDAAGR
jgi:hypothetical protein